MRWKKQEGFAYRRIKACRVEVFRYLGIVMRRSIKGNTFSCGCGCGNKV